MMPSLRSLPLVVLCLVSAAAAQDRTASFDALLSRYHEYGQFNGVALVAEGSEVVYAKGFGEADMSWNIPNTPSTKFRIGSVTKQFTAALVLQLVEQGLVDLDAPVTRYVPDYPAASGDRITVHHLLTHTAGIPNYTALPGFMRESTRDPYAPDSFLTVFSGLDLEFEPGSRFNYSNSGYFLLGVLIEHVTGQPYATVLQEKLLTPLGLTDTGYDTVTGIVDQLAAGYTKVGMGYERAAYLDASIPYAAGMMYSTAPDLLRWTQALHRAEPFARPETLTRMTTPFLEDYAYGIGVSTLPVGAGAVRMIGHSGGINGFSSMVMHMPDEQRTVVVLDNTEQGSGAVARALAFTLYGQPVDLPKRPIADVLAPVIDRDGVDAAVARYRTLKASEADAYDFSEAQLNALGYAYLGRGEVATAVRIFELNVEAFPEAWNVYDSLGEAFLAAGDDARATASYRRALDLNPGATSARVGLQRLGVETAPETVAVPQHVLQRYVGRYVLQPGFEIAVTLDGGRLFAQATGQSRAELHPSSETRFFLTVVDAQVAFRVGEAGVVEGLTLYQGGREMVAGRAD